MKLDIGILSFLALIAAVPFYYKVYLQSKILDGEEKKSLVRIFVRYYTIRDFMPLSLKVTDESIRMRKNANVALIIAYFNFAVLIFYSLSA